MTDLWFSERSGPASTAAAGTGADAAASSGLDGLVTLASDVVSVEQVERDQGRIVLIGQAMPNAAETFDDVAEALRTEGYAANLVRIDGARSALVLEPAEEPRADRPGRGFWNALLLVATLATTTWAGASHQGVDPLATPGRWAAGLPYAVALMLILGVHEMGHYVAARLRRVKVTLPYFIPAPFFLGTFGAFIRMEGRVRDRNTVFDVGASGPFAGLFVAMAAVVIGVAGGPAGPAAGHGMVPGSSFLFALLFRAAGGGDPGLSTALNPIAFAGWLGLLVTALNLIPVGQLDGGHVAYALVGRRTARKIGAGVVAGMVALGILASPHWLMWAGLVWFIAGVDHAPAVNDLRPLSGGRRILGFVTLVVFVSIIAPWPW